jgi:hypothetical protein
MSSLSSRSIILVSPEREENQTGWWPLESLFWSPIVTTGLYVLPNATFGQLAHLWFPNLQFVVCLAAAPSKTKQRGIPKACIHVSDRNVIEQHDSEALRGILLHTIREGSRREDALDGFKDLKLSLPFQASSLAAPALPESLAKLRTDLAAPDDITSGHMVVNDSVALRDLVSIPLPDIELHVHLLTETSLEEMEHKLRGKVFDLMGMSARIVAEDCEHSIESHVQVILGRDSSGETSEDTADFFELCEQWLNDVSCCLSGRSSAANSNDDLPQYSYLCIRNPFPQIMPPPAGSTSLCTWTKCFFESGSLTVPSLYNASWLTFTPRLQKASIETCPSASLHEVPSKTEAFVISYLPGCNLRRRNCRMLCSLDDLRSKNRF